MIILGSNKGWAMPLAIMIVMAAALLSAALFTYAINDSRHVDAEMDAQKARYLARSGIEAVIDAWKDSAVGSRLSGDVETIYQLTNGSFKNALTLQQGEQTIGKVDVKVTNNPDRSAMFEATAVVNGIAKKAAVTSSAYTNGDELTPKWYEKSTGVTIPPIANSQTNIIDGGTYILKYSDPSGVVIWDADNDIELSYRTLSGGQVVPDNANNKVGYVARAMYFRDPLNLAKYYSNGSGNAGVLVASAQTLVFEGEVRLFYNPFSSSLSTLVLHVPKSFGIKLQGKAGLFGKAYFKNNVILERPFFGNLTIVPAGAYYYKLKEVGGEEKGINLLDWAIWKNPSSFFPAVPDYDYTLDDFSLMDAISGSDDLNKAIPDPKENISFIWDW